MKLKKQYIDINDTLKCIKIQILDSIKFAKKNCPVFGNPEQLFYWLKENTNYKNDPKGIELLQTMQTMFARNGEGDCDCFVITSGACFIINGWDFDIVLVGRDKRNPVHIYTRVYFNGDTFIFDLTNPKYNMERPYKYVQDIPVNWENWVVKKNLK
jgi:hypothetical protein